MDNLILKNNIIDSFVQHLDVKNASHVTYGKALKQFALYLTDRNISQPTRLDILNYREYLKIDHKPTTVQLYITAVRQLFEWLEDEGLYKNIAKNIKGADIDKSFKRDPLTVEQLNKILAQIDTSNEKGARDYAMILIATTCGLRTIEIERANIEDLREVNGKTVLYVQGKGHDEKETFVLISTNTLSAIEHYLSFRKNCELNSPLFSSLDRKLKQNSGRLTTKSIRRAIKEAFRNAGYDSERLSAHSLRHTAATLNMLNGATIDETRQFMRHSSINTTLIYAHHINSLSNKSSHRIEDAIFGK